MYFICWIAVLVLFNVVIFITPDEIAGLSKFVNGFWVGYGFAIAAFAGQLLCSWFAFRESDSRKFFYNISLIIISYTALIISVIISIVVMVIPQIPAWIVAITCSVILVFNIIAVVKAKAAAETVAGIDEKVTHHTAFIRGLTADADIIVLRASTPTLKKLAKKVYEALRYSDPVSSSQLSSVENEISEKFAEFSIAISNADDEAANVAAEAIMVLIAERAEKCKSLKRS